MSKPGVSPRHFSNESQERIVLRLEGGETIAAVAGETGVRRKLLYQWRDAYRAMGTAGFNRKRGPKVMKGYARSVPQLGLLGHRAVVRNRCDRNCSMDGTALLPPPPLEHRCRRSAALSTASRPASRRSGRPGRTQTGGR